MKHSNEVGLVYVNNKDCLCPKWFDANYFKVESYWTLRAFGKEPYFLKPLIFLSGKLEKAIVMRQGNGTSICFWFSLLRSEGCQCNINSFRWADLSLNPYSKLSDFNHGGQFILPPLRLF